MRIYFGDDQGNQIGYLPTVIRLWDTLNDVGVRRERIGHIQFLSISWVCDY
jgi:hypothetical protein